MNIYSPLEKTYFDVTIRQHREFFNNKLQHSCSPLVIVQHVRSNESTRNLLCLFLSFSLFPPSPFRHEFSIEYQSVGKTIISVHRSHRQKPCAFWNGIPPPLSPTRCRSIFASSSSPRKTTLSFRPQGNKLFQQVIIVVVVSFDPGNEK